ncbi:hypothetical protein RCG17_11780 [Neobacillus sp. PS3-12]|uniref:hypothetical protein n=1 Tax=Neobacillus sp. PS3-12 TaxID=3070677 RepID=UPI0027DF2477|nr:hypothetical protein [Neobacillus sp. PS3-12]WML55201.1 hypothetical protein RCG17_11780 [Neobacillus sp. PS3-12]
MAKRANCFEKGASPLQKRASYPEKAANPFKRRAKAQSSGGLEHSFHKMAKGT